MRKPSDPPLKRPKNDLEIFWEWLKKQFRESPMLMMVIAFIVLAIVGQIGGCCAYQDATWWTRWFTP